MYEFTDFEKMFRKKGPKGPLSNTVMLNLFQHLDHADSTDSETSSE